MIPPLEWDIISRLVPSGIAVSRSMAFLNGLTPSVWCCKASTLPLYSDLNTCGISCPSLNRSPNPSSKLLNVPWINKRYFSDVVLVHLILSAQAAIFFTG
ncbi:MAG: hypothetical protein IPL55_00200 [Saprospiraceae bacterium]|nr:hypothetical protein [Saprospiraceae bacterium]